MILAAGLGTRLGSLSEERPKPLLPVADIPLIRYALALLRGHGIRDVVVNLHHRGEQIEQELGTEVAYSREEGLVLGTGGGLRRAAPFLRGERFFVVNGKILAEVDLAAVVAHHERSGALATLVVRRDPEAQRWGPVEVEEASGRVLSIRSRGSHMFTGIHLIEPALLSLLPEGVSDVVGDVYMPQLARGAVLSAYVMEGYFWEHSTLARYLAGNVNVLRGAVRPTHPPGPLVGIDPSAKVAPTARIVEPVRVGRGAIVGEGAVVGPDVVVGHGAQVAAGARLTRAVLWPGARAEGPLTDVIVTPRQTVRVVDS